MMSGRKNGKGMQRLKTALIDLFENFCRDAAWKFLI